MQNSTIKLRTLTQLLFIFIRFHRNALELQKCQQKKKKKKKKKKK